MREIKIPVDEKTIRELKVGDVVAVTGVMITARDAAHKYMVEEEAAEVKDVLRDGMIYHCGPVVRKDGETYSFVAAGPTTSIREEPYQATVMHKYRVRGIIGKGGMEKDTLDACREIGAVYLSAIGGLATILARSVKRVITVHKLQEFGVPEAMWVIDVDRFPAVVTMDAHGHSLHDDVLEASRKELERLLGVAAR
jgi:fumarate hydratase subunit beta